MIIGSRTPMRISFFGGGTDYPEYFERKRGAVLGMAINQYVYVNCLRLRSFLDFKYRISYSQLETCQSIDEIKHPVVREVFKAYNINIPLHMSTYADLPSSSGLGSSSAFTVGLLNVVTNLINEPINKIDLANKAIHFERGVLQEHVGVQDQYHAAFGGINRFDFSKERSTVTPIQMTSDCRKILREHLVLVYTGIKRRASSVLDEQIAKTKQQKTDRQLDDMFKQVAQAANILEQSNPHTMIKELGEILHESWMLKRSLSSQISLPQIDAIYDTGRACGAYGGKLCGAGGGGFVLLAIPPERQAEFCGKIAPLSVLPVRMDVSGSTIIYSDTPSNNDGLYTHSAKAAAAV